MVHDSSSLSYELQCTRIGEVLVALKQIVSFKGVEASGAPREEPVVLAPFAVFVAISG